MKKTVICIVSTAAAFVLATALNIQNMIWGDTPSVLGFVFSLVFTPSPLLVSSRALIGAGNLLHFREAHPLVKAEPPVGI